MSDTSSNKKTTAWRICCAKTRVWFVDELVGGVGICVTAEKDQAPAFADFDAANTALRTLSRIAPGFEWWAVQ